VDALEHLTEWLGLLRTRLDTPERRQQALVLCRLPLGLASMATKGGADPQVEKAYARARELLSPLSDGTLGSGWQPAPKWLWGGFNDNLFERQGSRV
jgi:hypothetical protein